MSHSPAVVAIDVSALPTHAFGPRSLMWWATMCMIAIEGMAFALAISSYLYLKGGCRAGRRERPRLACSGARSTS